jgi:hypothetical protein
MILSDQESGGEEICLWNKGILICQNGPGYVLLQFILIIHYFL